MNKELARSVRRIEDRIAINELLARYSNAIDDRDMDAFAECFTEDFEFESVAGHSKGRDAALEYYTERMSHCGFSFHVPHTLILDFIGENSAVGTVTAHAELQLEEQLFVTAFRYHDKYQRVEGSWRFASRTVRTTYAMPLRDLAGSIDRHRRRWPGTEPMLAELPEGLESWRAFVGA